MKRGGYINRVSDRGRMLSRIHAESKEVVIFIYRKKTTSQWEIPCSKCLKLFSAPDLDLDEIDEGRQVHGGIPDCGNPARQQLLCRICHMEKTDVGHQDWVGVNLPLVKMALLGFEIALQHFFPPVAGAMKQRLEDVLEAIIKAKEVLYAESADGGR